MSLVEAILLGVVQGVTEFVPISSSGHLVLFESLFGLQVEELLGFDVILHAGTLFALCFVFWSEIRKMLTGDWRLALKLVVATLPAAVVGVIFKDDLEAYFRSPEMVAVAFLATAVLFALTYRARARSQQVRWQDVIWMSLAQAVALIPGVSRSGSTVAVGQLSGLERSRAAEFSFLMLLPVTLGAVGLVVVKGDATLPPTEIWLGGFAASAVSSFLVAKGMLKFFRKFGLLGFSIYLLLISGVLLWVR